MSRIVLETSTEINPKSSFLGLRVKFSHHIGLAVVVLSTFSVSCARVEISLPTDTVGPRNDTDGKML